LTICCAAAVAGSDPVKQLVGSTGSGGHGLFAGLLVGVGRQEALGLLVGGKLFVEKTLA
jgi:hypothetical protein